ncbi:hypothetical protein Hanom_Chr00s003356g01712121 [Helianthus anomalus]
MLTTKIAIIKNKFVYLMKALLVKNQNRISYSTLNNITKQRSKTPHLTKKKKNPTKLLEALGIQKSFTLKRLCILDHLIHAFFLCLV